MLLNDFFKMKTMQKYRNGAKGYEVLHVKCRAIVRLRIPFRSWNILMVKSNGDFDSHEDVCP